MAQLDETRQHSMSKLDEAEEPLTTDDTPPYSRGHHTTSKRVLVGRMLQIYIAFLVTLICALQLMRVSPFNGCARASEAGTAAEYHDHAYSRDLRYMSLDHKYDGLWEWGNMSTLKVPEPELGTGEEIDAAISMYVCATAVITERCLWLPADG